MALDYNIIGERLKKARIDNNLTQEKLAEKLDVSIAFLSNTYLVSEFDDILKNTTPEKQKLIYKIAKIINED